MIKLDDEPLDATQKLIAEIMKQSDNKIFEQLDDLKFGSLAKEISRVKQPSTIQHKAEANLIAKDLNTIKIEA